MRKDHQVVNYAVFPVRNKRTRFSFPYKEIDSYNVGGMNLAHSIRCDSIWKLDSQPIHPIQPVTLYITLYVILRIRLALNQ